MTPLPPGDDPHSSGPPAHAVRVAAEGLSRQVADHLASRVQARTARQDLRRARRHLLQAGAAALARREERRAEATARRESGDANNASGTPSLPTPPIAIDPSPPPPVLEPPPGSSTSPRTAAGGWRQDGLLEQGHAAYSQPGPAAGGAGRLNGGVRGVGHGVRGAFGGGATGGPNFRPAGANFVGSPGIGQPGGGFPRPPNVDEWDNTHRGAARVASAFDGAAVDYIYHSVPGIQGWEPPAHVGQGTIPIPFRPSRDT